MKTKIILIALIAFGALASFASTKVARNKPIEKSKSSAVVVKSAKSAGFVSEEI